MDEQKLPIRPARIDEIEELRAIEDRAARIFADVDLALLLELDATSASDWGRSIAAGTAWVATDESDRPIAFALCQGTPDALHLQELDVDPSVARRGIGAALIELVVRQARDLGHPRVTLTTYRDVPWNAPYYRRLGFRILEDGELGPRLSEVRRTEQELGLDAAPRVAMERRL